MGTDIKDTEVGTGAEAKKGQTVEIHYVGWVWENNAKGNQFDSSLGRGPFRFQVGVGQVISGWDQGVLGMKEGGKRVLTIPPEEGYGARGHPGGIPPNATLRFEIELLRVS